MIVILFIIISCLYNNKNQYTVVPLMRDHKESPQKWSLKRGLPYYPRPRGQRVQYLVCVCVCLSVCYHKIAVKFNYLKI